MMKRETESLLTEGGSRLITGRHFCLTVNVFAKRQSPTGTSVRYCTKPKFPKLHLENVRSDVTNS